MIEPATTDTPENAGKWLEYPKGQSHGVTVYVQLNDDNQLYDTLTDKQRQMNNDRGNNADSHSPHYLGTTEASWTDGTDEIGFFSTKVQYGEQHSGKFTQYYAQVLNLYDSVEDASIANNAAKRRVEVHKRTDGLVYSDGNEYTWPEGWISGNRREGTMLKIQASYVRNPSEAIADAFELIEASGLLSHHELSTVKQPITETVRFSGLESHHRIHNTHEKDAIDTLRDSAKLVATEGDGKEKATIEKGHHQIYSFRNDRIDFLGFDTSVEWEYRGDEYTDTVDSHYLKAYRHTNADQFPDSDPRAHPKIEVKADGAYPGPAWPAVKHHLDTVLNAHTHDFAGIPESGLVADMYHDGPNQETTITESPAEYRANLRSYFKSSGLKKDILSLLVNNRTDSAKDILHTVIQLGRPVSYDKLKERTGLTKRTIRKWVSELEDLNIVERQMDVCMFVRMSDFVREHLRSWLDKLQPIGDTKRGIQQRKQERIAAREDTDTPAQTDSAVATDGGSTDSVGDTEQPSTQSISPISDTPVSDNSIHQPPD